MQLSGWLARFCSIHERFGWTTSYTFDHLHRLTDEVWLDPADPEGDPLHTIAFVYNNVGDLISASDASSSYVYLHDVLGRVETATFSSALTGFDVEVGRDYDALGQRNETSFDVQGAAGDFVNEYEFDLLGRVASIRQTGSGVASKFVDFSYDFATEAIDSIRRFEGTDDSGTLVLTSDFDFDAMGRITGIHHFLDTDADRDWDTGETRLAGYAFAWDVRSRITGIDSLADGQIDFGYDETSQLTSAAYESGHPLHASGESYQFDSNGNRTMDGYYHGRDNQLLADGQYRYTFDAEGHTTGRTDTATGEHTEYAWDHRGRLASVSVYEDETKADLVSRVVYTYDVFDRRIAKQIDSNGDLDFDVEEHFVYDGDHIAMVFDGSDTLRHRYLHGPVIDMILADEAFDATGDPVELYWALGDHQGTIRDVVIYDDIGEETVLVQHLVIDTFGNLVELQVTTAAPILAFAYTGREYDAETGLHYYRARYYDASTGRFLSQDPIGFRGGDANLYRYVGNGATHFRDPFGLEGTFVDGLKDAGYDFLDWLNPVTHYYEIKDIWNNGFSDDIEKLNRLVDDPSDYLSERVDVICSSAKELVATPEGQGYLVGTAAIVGLTKKVGGVRKGHPSIPRPAESNVVDAARLRARLRIEERTSRGNIVAPEGIAAGDRQLAVFDTATGQILAARKGSHIDVLIMNQRCLEVGRYVSGAIRATDSGVVIFKESGALSTFRRGDLPLPMQFKLDDMIRGTGVRLQ